jgi:hypothetical protein
LSAEYLRRQLDDIDYDLMYEERLLAPDFARIRRLQEQRAYVVDNLMHLRRIAAETHA